MPKPRATKWYFLFLVISVASVVLFQNCGEVKLRPAEPIVETASSVTQGLFPPPVNAEAPLRVVFLVDQSHSMKYAGCPTDLDGVDPKAHSEPCEEGPGQDPDMIRLDMVNRWVEYLKWFDVDGTGRTNIKVAVVPFSGGMRRFTPPAGGFQFKTLNDVAADVENLRDIQTLEPDRGEGKKMGTTVPLRAMDDVYALLDAQMAQFADQDTLRNATVEVVMITDGYLKPYEALLKKAQELAGCPTNCATNPGQEACSPSGTIGWENDIDPYKYCHVVIPQKFNGAFGDSMDNDPGKIADKIKEFLDLPAQYDGGVLNFRIVQTEYREPGPNDHIQVVPQIASRLTSETRFFTYQVNVLSTPFALQPKMLPQLSYVVEAFYAINLNGHVDEFGKMVVDSDGDGVSDKEELAEGLNPTRARSSTTEGRCLDGIFVGYGCVKGGTCDPLQDEDGDGLNQCEEMTLNTKAFMGDSDTDRVLDFFEARGLGLNPNQNESGRYRSGDAYTDHQHFSRGVHIQVPLEAVDFAKKISFELFALKSYAAENLRGNPIRMTEYKVVTDNLPLVNTQAVGEGRPAMFTFRTVKKEKQKVVYSDLDWFGPTAHAAGVNQYVFLVKMVATENPNSNYWLVQRRDILYQNEGRVQIDLDLRNFHELVYLQ